jgi:T-complex protein 1 subunit zeta
MGSVKTLNPNAETMGKSAALFMNINAAKGLHEVMKTNFGPKGTIKMLVGGAGGELGVGSPQGARPGAASARRAPESRLPPPTRAHAAAASRRVRPTDIKLTKDGNVLLREMQIQNPTAVMIARTAVAQDDVTG